MQFDKIVQTVTENIVQIPNNVGQDGFEQLESNDIKELFQSWHGDLTKMEEILNVNFNEEEPAIIYITWPLKFD